MKANHAVGYCGLYISMVATLCAALVTAWYFSLLHRFSSAEIFSAANGNHLNPRRYTPSRTSLSH